jgi:hypothetical protein
MGHESYDLTVTAWADSVSKGGTYTDMASTLRINLPNYWGDGKTGQTALMKEIRQFLKGKKSTQSADTWDPQFMELVGRLVFCMVGAEGTRAFVMIPLSQMMIEMMKYAKADLGSLYLTNINSINDKTWKGDIVPYWQDVSANAGPLKNAARVLGNDSTLDHTQKVQGQGVISEMEKLVVRYFETYLSEAKGVKDKSKFDPESVTSDQALETAVKKVIERKFLDRIWKPLD